MPMSRYQIRNAYSLADPELYRAADKDDPEALLEGVAMAGLVGVLRQLGDLAEFAAEIFHNLHEEVMATATRGHGLTVRVQQLEAEFPSIEKAFLSQTNHSAFFSNAGTDWHPNLRTNHNLVTRGDLPRFVMDSYEDCRGPPRLFLLDKFDVAGAGACLKRYTDPSFFKVEALSYGPTNAEVQREKKSRKPKKKGSRWRNGGTPEVLSTSNAKLHQLFLEERVENGVSDPARLVKLKRRLNGFPFTSKTGKSYMEKFINKSLVEDKVVHEICYGSSPLKLPSASDSGVEVLETSRTVLRSSMDELREDLSDEELSSGPKQCSNSGTGIISPTLHEMVDEKEIVVDGESKTDGIIDGYQSDDIASEVDNYMDALATMDSEVEMDSEFRTKTDLSLVNIEKQGTDSDENEEQLQAQFSDSQSVGKFTASDDGNSSSKKGISSFSYSDTGSISAEVSPANEISKTEITDVSSEKIPENKEDTPFPANEISKTDITDMSSEKIPENKEDTPFQPPKHEGTHNAYIEVADIPSYMPEFGEPSSSVSLTDSAPICLPVDQEELVEISSNHDELDKECMRTKESETKKGGNLPWKSRHSYLPSQTRDDFPITGMVSAENHHVDKLDDEDPVVHFSNNLEVVPKMESCESSSDNVLQTDHAEDGRDDVSETKNLVASRISSPHSVISHAEDEPSVPALLEFETCNKYLKPEVVDSIDDVVPSSREITVDSISALYNSDNTEQKDDVPPLKIDSVEVDIHYEENLSKEDDEEMAGIDSIMNLIGSDATTLEISSDFVNSIGPRSLTGFPLHLDERETEIGLSENVVASPDGDADEVDFSSTTKSQEESIQKSDENDFAVHDYCLQQSHNTELGKQKEVIDEEIASSPNSDSIPCEAPFCDHSVSELVNHFPDPLAAEAESKLRLDEATMVPMFPKSSGQDSELVSPKQSNLIVDTDDALPSSPHDFSERTTPFEQNLTLRADVDETKSKETSQWEQVQSPEHIDDHSEPIPPIVSKPVVQVDIESDRLDVESLQGVKSNCESSSKLEQMQFTDNERISDSSPKASSMHLPSEVSESGPLQTSTHKVGVSEQERDLFSSVPPGFPLFPPEVPNVNLEEMPPLPPLPPVQWRIGRPQQASPMVPSKADNNIQTGYPTLDGNILLPPAPVLSSSAVRDEVSQHTVHSSPFCMQMPIISSDRDSLIDYRTSDSTPNMVPLLTLPSTCNEGPQHGLIAGEVGVMQPSVDPFLTVTNSGDAACTYAPGSIHETLNHSQHLLPPDASLENERLERNFVSSEVKMVNLPETNLPQQTMADEEPKYVSTTSEGEIVWSTSQSLFPAVEDGMLNGTRPMKLLRPRSPLIDAVAAHDKSKLRKVTERVRPETQKLEERDSLLEEIRAKSVNLKPAAVTRPSIKGPATNLRVAAILQKANAIRQALAGSDEDDEEDSWSDS